MYELPRPLWPTSRPFQSSDLCNCPRYHCSYFSDLTSGSEGTQRSPSLPQGWAGSSGSPLLVFRWAGTFRKKLSIQDYVIVPRSPHGGDGRAEAADGLRPQVVGVDVAHAHVLWGVMFRLAAGPRVQVHKEGLEFCYLTKCTTDSISHAYLSFLVSVQ